ncbi:hypothetical protein MUU72_15210 [Streptomyces sp. RS10V-4]|uniref:hypothetical protein n=1 Tax=Streptomyces rhizoryzae TaxID=2932493 RepID=UPI0020062012|nr:hypothetical protein [Streptomyces rhizoryzae]MCK7624434.1 hypothetical protein [Streptomyces rhizoryzae]
MRKRGISTLISVTVAVSLGLATTAEADATAESSVIPSMASEASRGDVYVSPSGKKSNPGTASRPVRDLSDVRRVLNARRAHGHIRVLFRGGTYKLGQQEWKDYQAESITFRPESANAPVRFDGRKAQKYWLVVRPTRTKMTLTGLHVAGYTVGGIFLRGEGTADSQRVIGATVDRMVFTGLGTETTGYAAVHLNYASNTTVRDSQFIGLANGKCPGCMHAVYFAQQSNDNKVTGRNGFLAISGDAVRASDYSNRNRVEYGSAFAMTGVNAVFSAWRIRDRDPRCSAGNVFVTDTDWYAGFKGKRIPAVMSGQDKEYADTCPHPQVTSERP